MDYKKILIFAIVLTLYVNYENYLRVDTHKKYAQITALKDRITQEKNLNTKKAKDIQKNLKISFSSLMFQGKRYSYSQAMGVLQNQITKSAKDIAVVKRIKWSQTVKTKLWYDKLRIAVYLQCTPGNFVKFMDKLKSNRKLYKIENFRGYKDRKNRVFLSFQIVAYRIKNAKK
jgi:hypothetical protein